MARDTKLRMSIEQDIVELLDEFKKRIDVVTDGVDDAYKIKQIRLGVPDSTDYLLFDFNYWLVRRCKEKCDEFDRIAEDGWEITKENGSIKITTFGKMNVDINREIAEQLVIVESQIDKIEDYLCANVKNYNLDRFVEFLEKYVRGKTDCPGESVILDDLEDWLKVENA